jgi:hypothetical protein
MDSPRQNLWAISIIFSYSIKISKDDEANDRQIDYLSFDIKIYCKYCE